VAPVGLPWDVNPADAAIIEPFTHGLTAQYLDGRTRLILSQGYEITDNGDGTWTVVHHLHENVYLHPHSLSDSEKVNASLIVWLADRVQYYSAWPTGMIDVYEVGEYHVAFVWEQLRNATPSMTMPWVTSRMIYETYGLDVLAETPISAGPFRVIEYVRGSHVIYERFDRYFREGQPYLDGMTYVFLGDRLTQGLALRTEGEGRVDSVRTLAADFASEFIRDGFDIITMDNITIVAVLPNDDPANPLANPLVRRAVSHAIDRDTIATHLGFGVHTPALQHIPPQFGGFNATPGYGAPPFNVEAGRALMQEAGFGPDNPLRTTLIPRPGLVTDNHAVVIQDMLTEIWIEADLNIMDIGGFTEVRQQTGWDGIMLCAYISWMQPEDSGRMNFEHIPGINPNWLSLVPSDRMLELIEASMFFGDVVPAVMELSDYILDDDFLWIIPIWYQGMINILHPRLYGWAPGDHMLFPEQLWIGG